MRVWLRNFKRTCGGKVRVVTTRFLSFPSFSLGMCLYQKRLLLFPPEGFRFSDSKQREDNRPRLSPYLSGEEDELVLAVGVVGLEGVPQESDVVLSLRVLKEVGR